MSQAYDLYLQLHTNRVYEGYAWIKQNLPKLLHDSIEYGGTVDYEWQLGSGHDRSKYTPDEYAAYDAYFYGGNRSYAVVQAFNYAWLHHIHNNPHHWQHWILTHDDLEEGETILEMPHNFIIEMICDWWSFSWGTGNLHEIFSWYESHKAHIKLHPKTRVYVENALEQIRAALIKLEEETDE